MSLLNLASDGLPSVLVVLFRYLYSRRQPIQRPALERACFPRMSERFGMGNAGLKLGQTLNRWTALGLFSSEGSGGSETITLSPLARGWLQDVRGVDEATSALPALSRHIAFLPRNRQRLWHSTDNQAADFSRALAWLCLLDVWSLTLASGSEAESLEHEHFTIDQEAEIFRNTGRWSGFTAWASFFAFGFDTSQGFRIDPTPAVRDDVRSRYSPGDVVPVDRFATGIAASLPVLDHGEVWREVAEKVHSKAWTRPQDNEFSPAFSMALLRLDREGFLTLESRSDVGKKTLLGRRGRAFGRSATHVVIHGGDHGAA